MSSTALVTQDAPADYIEPSLTGIQPISIKKTLMLVNSFVLNTTEFLNKFASLCEQKLSNVSQQVQRVEIVLALLEAKLDSIQWMGGGAATAASGAPAAPAMGGGVPAAPAQSAPAEAAPAADGPKLKDDPRYGRYFKMLSMGVPKAAIKQKMSADGCDDPSQIDNDPEGPAPAGGASASASQALVAVESAGGSDSEVSDAMSDDE